MFRCRILRTRIAFSFALTCAVWVCLVAADPARPADAMSGKSGAPAATTPSSAFPSGATALTETYGDWSVICSLQAATTRCSARQEQINQQSRQLVLAVELAPDEEKVAGIAVLPFGLAFEKGVALQVDDLPAATAQTFRTCLPAGCLVPLAFDTHAIAALRGGTTLKVKVFVDGGGETVLPVSLKGFANALDRTAALVASPHRVVAQTK
jgi:invasion protein IalB